MATTELRDLRHKYKEAYTTYLSCVQAVSDASQKGLWLSPDAVEREERSFNELSFLRQALLDALYAHARGVASNSKGPTYYLRRSFCRFERRAVDMQTRAS